MKQSINILWFTSDLTLSDNTAWYYALRSELPVLPIFIFDKNILELLENKQDARVEFIHETLSQIQEELLAKGSTLKVLYDTPLHVFEILSSLFSIENVFTNHDYEPYAKKREEEVSDLFQKLNIKLLTFKDQVIFEMAEIVKDDGKPYTVFTPYSRKWKATFDEATLQSFPSEKYLDKFLKTAELKIPTLEEMGFQQSEIYFPQKKVATELIQHYGEDRNFPGIEGTSRLGIHFRFGTLSIRKAVARAMELSPVFLNELIWRDFY